MTKQLFPLLISFSLLFFSCSKDDSSTPNVTMVQQSVYSVIEISNSPGLDNYTFSTQGDISNSIQVLNGSFSYTSDVYDIDLPPGVSFGYIIQFVKTGEYGLGCADVEIRTYHNNNLIDTRNFQMGYSQITPSVIYCDPLVASLAFTTTLDIEAN